jgi:hypothetical protein
MSDAEAQLRAHDEVVLLRVAAGSADELVAIVREFSSRVQRLEQELRDVRGILESADAQLDVREPDGGR